MLRHRLVVLSFAACLLAGPPACASNDSVASPAHGDAGGDSDQADSSATENDALDANVPHDSIASDVVSEGAGDAAGTILGDLSGTCGVIAGMLASKAPSLVENEVTFGTMDKYERAALSAGGQVLYDTPNAGGTSTESEVMSYEVLRYCDGASLQKSETEIAYAPPDETGPNSITDILVSIGGARVGVSVTRAYKPLPLTMTDGDVKDLLEKKLNGINRSSVRVLPSDKWVKQILHVWVADPMIEQAIKRVLPTIDATVRADTIVLVTQSKGGGFMYCDPDPPAGTECPPLK